MCMCIKLIQVTLYTALFNWIILLLMAVAVYQSGTGVIYSGSTVKINNFTGFVFVMALILYMGARPVSPEFGDTINYAAEFQTLQTEESGNWMAQAASLRGEWLFAVILHAWEQYGYDLDYIKSWTAE